MVQITIVSQAGAEVKTMIPWDKEKAEAHFRAQLAQPGNVLSFSPEGSKTVFFPAFSIFHMTIEDAMPAVPVDEQIPATPIL